MIHYYKIIIGDFIEKINEQKRCECGTEWPLDFQNVHCSNLECLSIRERVEEQILRVDLFETVESITENNSDKGLHIILNSYKNSGRPQEFPNTELNRLWPEIDRYQFKFYNTVDEEGEHKLMIDNRSFENFFLLTGNRREQLTDLKEIKNNTTLEIEGRKFRVKYYY